MLVIVVLWPVKIFDCYVFKFHTYTDPPSVPAKRVSAQLSKPIEQTLDVWFENVSLGLVFVIFQTIKFF